MSQNQHRKLSRDEILQIIRKNQGRLLYQDFQKIILDFQLQEHEKFLKNFTNLFKQIDTDSVGYLNEPQFRILINGMELFLEEDQVNYLLQEIDPYNNNKMTYSEIVQLLSSQMVPSNNNPNVPSNSIPILEKFSLIHEQTQEQQQLADTMNAVGYTQDIMDNMDNMNQGEYVEQEDAALEQPDSSAHNTRAINESQNDPSGRSSQRYQQQYDQQQYDMQPPPPKQHQLFNGSNGINLQQQEEHDQNQQYQHQQQEQ